MPAKHAVVNTDDAARYLKRLCKHFSHKIEATWSDSQGRLEFDIGRCRLQAATTGLELHCEAPDQQQLDQLGEVVASHLIRFAGGEVDAVHWQTVTSPDA
ncbi:MULTISPECIES: DUF2218 domain-containing protein [Marinobacter]|uniref:DUF2218 domain-containing protein n=1 Tax=Marinobacter TaxID=2742 RepID=UPI00124528C4|nr:MULTISPECIES: DUF2218 domain-containing protein [Marinobacter]MBL3555832.1 DUF2218 domain-containing protein [Marinobacter sp. JB05H06]